MTIAEQADLPESAGPELRLVPTDTDDAAIIAPVNERYYSAGELASAIKQLGQTVVKLYRQTDSEASPASPSLSKRQRVAVAAFEHFGMLDEAVETEFIDTYRQAERYVDESNRMAIVDIVEDHFDHPIIQATLALSKQFGNVVDREDIMAVQRASAVLLDEQTRRLDEQTRRPDTP